MSSRFETLGGQTVYEGKLFVVRSETFRYEDVEGAAPLDAAKRELAEEIGKAADHWEHLVTRRR